MTSVSPARKTFGWVTRLKCGWLAAVVAWFAGWIISFPFEFSVAWRYVDGNARLLPEALVKGLLVWGALACLWPRQDSLRWFYRPSCSYPRAGWCAGEGFLSRRLGWLPSCRLTGAWG